MNIFARFYFRAARLEREKRENKCSANISTFTVFCHHIWPEGKQMCVVLHLFVCNLVIKAMKMKSIFVKTRVKNNIFEYILVFFWVLTFCRLDNHAINRQVPCFRLYLEANLYAIACNKYFEIFWYYPLFCMCIVSILTLRNKNEKHDL